MWYLVVKLGDTFVENNVQIRFYGIPDSGVEIVKNFLDAVGRKAIVGFTHDILIAQIYKLYPSESVDCFAEIVNDLLGFDFLQIMSTLDDENLEELTVISLCSECGRRFWSDSTEFICPHGSSESD